MEDKTIYGISRDPNLSYPPIHNHRFRTQDAAIEGAIRHNMPFIYAMDIKCECIGRIENGKFKWND